MSTSYRLRVGAIGENNFNMLLHVEIILIKIENFVQAQHILERFECFMAKLVIFYEICVFLFCIFVNVVVMLT
jgi:hypothetical protein